MLEKLTTTPSANCLMATASAISQYIHRTPILTSEALNQLVGAQLYFKCENFQKIGAFKMRGGISAALRLNPEQRQPGLATHSSGNHAQAVARAAQLLDVPSYIVMPRDAPKVKIEATQSYGAQITFCDNHPATRQATLEELIRQTGASFIHPYNDWGVIAGQATTAMELLKDLPSPPDLLIAPVGGGGLLAGSALAVKYFSPQTRVYGAEPAQVDDAYRSLKSGRIETNRDNRTIADGLRTHLGNHTFHTLSEEGVTVHLVSEEEIIVAMRLLWERLKIVIEPSSAVAFAAIFKNRAQLKQQHIAIILTGGNVDLNHLPFSALLESG